MSVVDRSVLGKAVDVSHWNGAIDWPAVAAGGVRVAVIKATQGMVVDPRFAANRDGATKAGILVLWYPFLAPSDGASTVAHALSVADGLVPMLDWEAPGVGDAVVERWMDAYEAKTNRAGFVYRGIWPPGKVTARIARWPWWLAEYRYEPRVPPWDGSPDPDWTKVWAAWQWSRIARVPGEPTPGDADVLAMPYDVFAAFVKTGTWPMWGKGLPAPSDAPPPVRGKGRARVAASVEPKGE